MNLMQYVNYVKFYANIFFLIREDEFKSLKYDFFMIYEKYWENCYFEKHGWRIGIETKINSN